MAPLDGYAVLIADNYYGADDHGYGDRIGGSQFEIYWMDVDISGTSLSVDIKTNYRGNAYDGFPTLDTDVPVPPEGA